MGWVLLGVTFFFILDVTASQYAYLDYRLHDGRLPLGWLAVLLAPSWAPAIVLAGLSVLLFPDGRVPSSRWKPMLESRAEPGNPAVRVGPVLGVRAGGPGLA
jgi:hypothetical protein